MQINKYNDHFIQKYNISGNACLEEAEVVVVADIPVHPLCDQWNILLIHNIWSNHLILVENEPKGVSVPIQQLNLKIKQCEVQGCDLPDVSELLKKEKRMLELVQHINSSLKENKTQEWRKTILNSLKELMSLRFEEEFPGEQIKFDELKVRYENFLKNWPSFSDLEFAGQVYSITQSIQLEFKLNIKIFYKNYFLKRQKSFEQSIEEGLKSHKKVLIILNINHVVCNPKLSKEEYDIKAFNDYLKNKKYVIVNTKNSYLNVRNVPFLWEGAKNHFPKARDKKKENTLSNKNN